MIFESLIDRLQRVFNRDPQSVAAITGVNKTFSISNGIMTVEFSPADHREYSLTSGSTVTPEQMYLAENPDVAAAVTAGEIADGYTHYLVYGEREGRIWRPPNILTIAELVAHLNADSVSAVVANAAFNNLLANGLQDTTGSTGTAYMPQSLLWAELKTYAWELGEQYKRIGDIEKEMYLDSADGEWLDYWGSYFGIPRIAVSGVPDTDERYCARIVREVISPNQNNKALENLVEYLFDDYYPTDSPLVLCEVVDAFGNIGKIHYNGQYAHNGQHAHNGGIAGQCTQFKTDIWCELLTGANTIEQIMQTKHLIDRKKAAGTTYNYIMHAMIPTPSGEAAATAVWTATDNTTVENEARSWFMSGTHYAAPALLATDFWDHDAATGRTNNPEARKTIASVTIKNAVGDTIVTENIADFVKTTGINFEQYNQSHTPRALLISPALTVFDAAIDQIYLDRNPDVAAAVARGEFTDGLDHYTKHGQSEFLSGIACREYPSGSFVVPNILFVNTIRFAVGGHEIVAYKYALDPVDPLDIAGYSAETSTLSNSINLIDLSQGEHTLYVIGKNADDVWQDTAVATTATWIVDSYNPKMAFHNMPAELTKRNYLTDKGGINDSSLHVGRAPTADGPDFYRYRLDYGMWSDLIAIATEKIQLTGLKQGLRTIEAIGYTAYGKRQADSTTYSWTINTDYFLPTAVITNSLQTVGGPFTDVVVTISGENVENTPITAYKWKLGRGGNYSAETSIATHQHFMPDQMYLDANPDVAAAVLAGQFTSGLDHYIKHGQFEYSPYNIATHKRKYPSGVFKLYVLGKFTEDGVDYWQKKPTIATWRTRIPTGTKNNDPDTPDPGSVVATFVSGVPVSPSENETATIVVGGYGVVTYQYQFDGGGWSAEIAVATPISLSGIANGNHTIQCVGKNSAGTWQARTSPTTATWTTAINVPVDTTPPVTTAIPSGGQVYNGSTVALTSVDDSPPIVIRYTDDGSTPTDTSTIYSSPIIISHTGFLKYFGTDSVGNKESVKTSGYTVTNTPTGIYDVGPGKITCFLRLTTGRILAAVAYNNTSWIIASDNLGVDWTPYYSTTVPAITYSMCQDVGNGRIFRALGSTSMIYSDNQGATWSAQVLLGSPPHDVLHVASALGSTIAIRGLKNDLVYFRSADGGATWQQKTFPVTAISTIQDVVGSPTLPIYFVASSEEGSAATLIGFATPDGFSATTYTIRSSALLSGALGRSACWLKTDAQPGVMYRLFDGRTAYTFNYNGTAVMDTPIYTTTDDYPPAILRGVRMSWNRTTNTVGTFNMNNKIVLSSAHPNTIIGTDLATIPRGPILIGGTNTAGTRALIARSEDGITWP